MYIFICTCFLECLETLLGTPEMSSPLVDLEGQRAAVAVGQAIAQVTGYGEVMRNVW